VIKKQGGTKVALVGYNNPSSVQFIQNINDAVEKTPGLKVAYKTVDVPVDASDFGAVAQKIKDSGADALYTGMDFGPNTALTGALKQAGVSLKAVVFPGGYDSRAAGIPGMDQAIFGLEFKPFELNTAAYQDFTKWMGDKFKNQVSAIGWLSADAFVQGLKAAGVTCPTRAAFINNLRMVKNYDAGGFVDPINFADVFGKAYLCNYFVQVQNKAFAPLYNGKPLCAASVIDNGKVKKGTTGGAGPSTGIPTQ
jgi:ABC-type branched-subunit amino acid transport system substrate-binding protein